MTDKAIREFFEYRKEAWLKKHLKASMADVEVREKELEALLLPKVKSTMTAS
jgi:hypothetical protein